MSRFTRIMIAVFLAVVGSVLVGGLLALSEGVRDARGELLPITAQVTGFGRLTVEALTSAAAIALCAIPASIALVWRGRPEKPKRRMSNQHIPPRLPAARAREVVLARIDTPAEDEGLGPALPHRRKRRRIRRSA